MMHSDQKSGLWKHGLLLTLLFGFTTMIVGGVMMYRSRAPIPATVADPSGRTIFTEADIQNGQDLFRKRGLMDYGSVLGHGAYLGPDYTAEDCMALVTEMRVRHLPVLENNNVVGLVSIGDLVKDSISGQQFIIHELERYIYGVRGPD